MIKFTKYFFEAIFIYICFLVIKLIGLKMSRKLFSSIFRSIGPFFRKENVITKNILRYNPNISAEEIEKIKNNMWSNYGKVFAEYIYLRKFKNDSDHIKINGKEILQEIYQKKKPVIFISGHFANFELMSMEITKSKLKLATIYRPLNNFFINPFMEYFRRKYVCQYQIKKGINGVREAIEYIKKDYSIALMIDQRVSEGQKIKFFNNLALTTTLPAQLAMKYNLEIIPVFIQRINDEKFNLEFNNPINPKNFEDKIKLTEKLNNMIEKMIIRNPEQWIWTHDRWK